MRTLTRLAAIRLAASAAAAVTILAVGGAEPAMAYRERAFCLENNLRGGVGKMCVFDTFEQCVEYRSGIAGSCAANPWYRPYEPAPRRHRVRKHRR
jgi:hypothetical protein